MASEEQLAKLKAVVPAAQASQVRWGVPASVTLAQWIFESTWGTSKLALNANNYFGVKATHLNDPSSYVEMPTNEFVGGKEIVEEQDFEKYADEQGSFDAHAALLATATRYRPAMAVRENPTAFATQLKLCGYSSDPEYGNKLINEIRVRGLAQYDVAPSQVVTQGVSL